MIFIQINININRITLTKEATKMKWKEFIVRYTLGMPQKLPIVYFFTKDCNSAKIIGA